MRHFGLFGPNGPLPIHLTEYARERLHHAGDRTLSRFLDLFHHRFIALFYRAWAQAQPHVNRDRPDDDRFSGYVAAFVGLLSPACRHRDSVPDLAKFFHVGGLVRQVRNAEGLGHALHHFFRVPVAIEEFVGHWMALGPRERTFLGRDGATLGAGAVLGRTVWDRQHKFRIHLGPLTLTGVRELPPGRPPADATGGLGEDCTCSFELDWDVRLRLAPGEVPRLRLGAAGRLGWTAWLGTRPVKRDADDLCLHAETFVPQPGVTPP